MTFLKDLREAYRLDAGYLIAGEGWRPWRANVAAAVGLVGTGLARLACRVKGHDLVCDDWAGPESGGMGAHCERCGWSFETILY